MHLIFKFTARRDNYTKQMEQEWFKEWFDSPYYHTLYKYRDEQEAKNFIDRLIAFLKPKSESKMLDLACGKGRYSRHLASKGFEVVGLDLSPSSIDYARQFETPLLTFYTHDMRQIYRTNYFDYVFNFFTSFGYFKSDKEHLRTLKTIAAGLKPNGYFILDFFNAKKVMARLPHEEVRKEGEVEFWIKKWAENGRILKKIEVRDGDQQFTFLENVRAFEREDFEKLFLEAGLKITKIFGDYHLNRFRENESDRLILIARKGRNPVIFGMD